MGNAVRRISEKVEPFVPRLLSEASIHIEYDLTAYRLTRETYFGYAKDYFLKIRDSVESHQSNAREFVALWNKAYSETNSKKFEILKVAAEMAHLNRSVADLSGEKGRNEALMLAETLLDQQSPGGISSISIRTGGGVILKKAKKLVQGKIDELGRDISRMVAPLIDLIETIRTHSFKTSELFGVSEKDPVIVTLLSRIDNFYSGGSESQDVRDWLASLPSRSDKALEAISAYVELVAERCGLDQLEDTSGSNPRISKYSRKMADSLDEAIKLGYVAHRRANVAAKIILAVAFYRYEQNDPEAALPFESKLWQMGGQTFKYTIGQLLAHDLIEPEHCESLRAAWDERHPRVDGQKDRSNRGKVTVSDVSKAPSLLEKQKAELSRLRACNDALTPFVEDSAYRSKLARVVSVDQIEFTKAILIEALGDDITAFSLLRANPSLFELCADSQDKLVNYASDLEEVLPAIVVLVEEDNFNPADFASPEALDETLKKAEQDVAREESYQRIKTGLAELGFPAEVVIALCRYAFWHKGEYHFGNHKPLIMDVLGINLARYVSNSDFVMKRVKKVISKLVASGLIHEHSKATYTLGTKLIGDNPTSRVFNDLLTWIQENPPEERGVKIDLN